MSLYNLSQVIPDGLQEGDSRQPLPEFCNLQDIRMLLRNRKRKYTEKVFASVEWCHWFVLFNVFVSILIGIRYLVNTSTHSTVIGTVYEVINLLGHFWFLNFIVFLLIPFPLAFIITNFRVYRILVTVLAVLAQTCLIIDTQLYHSFSFHINIQLIQIFTDNSGYQSGMNFNFLMILLPILIVIEVVLSRYAKYKSSTHHNNWIAKTCMVILVSCFACTHIMHIWADSTKYEPIMTQESMFPLSYPMTARSFLARNSWLALPEVEKNRDYYTLLRYPLSSLKVKKESIKYYNYVVIGVRGWSHQTVNNEIMPYVTSLKDSSVYFRQHFATNTDPAYAMFSFFYGLIPQYRPAVIHDQTTPLLIDELQRQSYRIARYVTDSQGSLELENSEIFYGLRGKNQQISLTDNQTAKKALAFLEGLDQDDNYFLYISLDAPSMLRNESGISKFTPALQVKSILKPNADTDKNTTRILNSYQNALFSTDKEIEKVVEAVKASSSGSKTIIIILGETGFSFDQGDIRNFNASGEFTYENLHVPMMLIHPEGYTGQITHLTSHTDVAPSIMNEELGVINDMSDYSNGSSLRRENPAPFIIGGNEEKVAIINPEQITTFTKKGYYKVTDCMEKNHCRETNIQMPTLMMATKQLHRFYSD